MNLETSTTWRLPIFRRKSAGWQETGSKLGLALVLGVWILLGLGIAHLIFR